MPYITLPQDRTYLEGDIFLPLQKKPKQNTKTTTKKRKQNTHPHTDNECSYLLKQVLFLIIILFSSDKYSIVIGVTNHMHSEF